VWNTHPKRRCHIPENLNPRLFKSERRTNPQHHLYCYKSITCFPACQKQTVLLKIFKVLSHARIRHDQRDRVFNEARPHVGACGNTTVKFSTPTVRFAPLLLYHRRRNSANGHRRLSARCEEEKMFLRLPGTEPRLLCRSARSLINILTELSWRSLMTVSPSRLWASQCISYPSFCL
jgi:hypothetical protein